MSATVAMSRGRWVGGLLLVTAASLSGLFSGGAALEFALPGGLPAGNALAAVALIAPSGAAMALAHGRWALGLARCALAAAVAWLPLSTLLAGNLALVFGNGRGDTWIALSLATVALVALSLLFSLVTALWQRRKRTRPA